MQRFARDVKALGLAPDARLGLGVSGGPDSLAMLVLAHRAMPERIEAATVDHGLRAEAAAEAAMVARVCEELGVAHRTIRVSVAANGNLQAKARAARYAALAEWAAERGIEAIVTAHHADDQAETLLMRLMRGSGVRGLAGMRPRAAVPGTTDVPLVRPLLGWTRLELEQVVQDAALLPVSDPSNRDATFLRVRLRDWLMAAPEGVSARGMARSAAHLADDDDALNWAAGREWDERVTLSDRSAVYEPAAPRSVRLRVLSRIFDALGREGAPRGDEIARLVDRLKSGEQATLGGLVCRDEHGAWTFHPAPPRRKL